MKKDRSNTPCQLESCRVARSHHSKDVMASFDFINYDNNVIESKQSVNYLFGWKCFSTVCLC